MAVVVMSVDTITRETSVTVDGALVPAIACHLSKHLLSDGTYDVSLSYVVEVESNNGLREEIRFFLPDDDSVLASKVVKIAEDEDIQRDVDNIFK